MLHGRVTEKDGVVLGSRLLRGTLSILLARQLPLHHVYYRPIGLLYQLCERDEPGGIPCQQPNSQAGASWFSLQSAAKVVMSKCCMPHTKLEVTRRQPKDRAIRTTGRRILQTLLQFIP